MVAFRPDDSDLARDLEQTTRVLSNLRGFAAAGGWNETQLQKLQWQVEACEKHLALQRANVGAAT